MAKKKKGISFEMDKNVLYRRKGDYDPDLELILKIDCQGDISLGIINPSNPKELIRLVKFATLSGGGKSLNVLRVLPDLALAIEKDKKKNP